MQNEGTELIHFTVGSEWDFSQEPPGHCLGLPFWSLGGGVVARDGGR